MPDDTLEFRINNQQKVILDMAKTDAFVRDELAKALFQAGGEFVILAKNRLKSIRWQTKGGLWRNRRYRNRLNRREKAVLGKDFMRRQGVGGTYYKAGDTVIGHVVTGALGRSIKVLTTEKNNAFIRLTFGTGEPYAIYVELLPDGGFMNWAIVTGEKTFYKMMDDRFNDLIMKMNQFGGA